MTTPAPARDRRLGPGRYVLDCEPGPEVDECGGCGTDITRIDGVWYALESRWANLKHCYYSARTGQSVRHNPERDPQI